jgi:hypothetical protein
MKLYEVVHTDLKDKIAQKDDFIKLCTYFSSSRPALKALAITSPNAW